MRVKKKKKKKETVDLRPFFIGDRLVLSYRLVFFEHAERNCAKYERNGTITLMVKLLSENSVQ